MAAAALLMLAAPGNLAAQQSARVSGWHTVRPGETLRGITKQYLGSQGLWQQNWRLNPDLEDPDVLVPGERIRVLQAADKTVPTARLTALSGRVEGRPAPITWATSQQDDFLLERDSVRTFENASTELQFVDGTSVILNEASNVFLRRTGRRLGGVEKKSVEIVEGQAEFQARNPAAAGAEIEIVVGGTTATARIDESGLSQARARRAEDGTKVMIFEGSSEVVAGGEKVDVPRGMGTSVPQDAPPLPPEKLLDAPVVVAPAAGARLPYPNPEFAWAEVAGAASYTLEICRDERCTALVRRATDLLETRWRPDGLAVESFFWRVAGVSPSGLDGYASPPSAFEILTDRPDSEPPSGAITVIGKSQAVGSEVWWYEVDRVDVRVEDAVTEVAGWTPSVNGAAVDPAALAGEWESGPYVVEVEAVDRLGNRGSLQELSFQVDRTGPVLEWRIGGRELLVEAVGEELAGRDRRRNSWLRHALGRRSRWQGKWTVLGWSVEDRALADTYLPWRSQWEFRRGYSFLSVRGHDPAMLLVAPGVEIRASDDSLHKLAADEVVWLTARDEHSGRIRELRVRQPAGESALEVEVTDELGNRSVTRWALP